MYKPLPGGHLCYLYFSRPYFIVLKTIHVSPSTTHQAPLAFWKHALETFGSSPHIAIAWILHSPASRSLSWKSFNAISGASLSHMVNPLLMNTLYNCSLNPAINYSWCSTTCRDRWKRRSEMGGVVFSFLVFNSCEVLPGKKACWESFGILRLSHFSIISGSFNIFQKECFWSVVEIPWLRRLPLVATNKLPKSLCQSPFRSDEHLVGFHTSESTQSLKSPSDMPSLSRSASSKSFAAFSCGV